MAGAPTTEDQVEERLAAMRAQLEPLGRPELHVGQLDSERYPGLGFRLPTVLVYVGPFSSQQEAEDVCPTFGIGASACHARQPGKPKAPE
jgi:hypothetical protein